MSHKASYNIFKVAVQCQWLWVLLQSPWSQPVPLFITPQAFLFLLPGSLLWRRAGAFLQRSMRYEPYSELEANKKNIPWERRFILSLPPDGQYVAAAVNELAAHQNLNCSTHWCWENKQGVFTVKLACFAKVWFASVLSMIAMNACVTWFLGQTRRCCSQRLDLCPASLWPASSSALPVLSDSKWSEIRGNIKTHTDTHIYIYFELQNPNLK